MAATYYAQLDSTRFASDLTSEQRQLNTVTALGAVLLDLVSLDQPIVLSQNQVFDSALLLDTVHGAPEQATGLLRLIETDAIQTRIFDGPGLRHCGPETFTVHNAFRSALDSGFRFSAWPELADPDVRRVLVRQLDRADGRGSLGADAAVDAWSDDDLALDEVAEEFRRPHTLSTGRLAPQVEERASILVDPATPGEFLDWATAADLRRTLATQSTAVRIQALFDRRVLSVGSDGIAVRLVRSVGRTGSRLAGSSAGAVIGSATGGVGGAVVGAALGTLAEDAVSGLARSRIDRAVDRWTRHRGQVRIAKSLELRASTDQTR